MPALRRTALAVLLAVGVLGAPVAAAAATSPSPSPSPSASSAAGAAELRGTVDRLTADLQSRSALLDAARETARAALERRQLAQRAAGQAEQAAARARAAHAAAEVDLRRSRTALRGFAGALYRQGPEQQGMSYLTAALLSTQPGALLHDVEVAEQIGDGRAAAYARFRAAETAQRETLRRSTASSAAAARLRAAAARAEQEAVEAVAAQAAAVDLRTRELALAVDAAAVADRREALLAQAEKIALERSRAGIPLSALAGALVPRPTGTCVGGDLAGYPNGHLPEPALCPLWGTAGQVLRADAAAAFNALSRRYAEQYGFPLCVTDSYRSYPEQVAVRAAKPTLAAVPGTSNHGWGVALDLCGGAERFGTPLHLWLVEHAAEYGWFLPAWAQQGGSKPEPWHWEYAG